MISRPPTIEEVKAVRCPYCAAQPGFPCKSPAGWVFRTGHEARVALAMRRRPDSYGAVRRAADMLNRP
jgi:hypothetical protein